MYWGWITKGFILATLSILVFVLSTWIFFLHFERSNLRIVFLNVGQGDAILIQDGWDQVVIDGGRDGNILLDRLGRFIPFADRTIEVLIPTHPDADHIGGLSRLLKRYTVATVLDTGARSDTNSASSFYHDLEQESAERIPAVRGVYLDFPSGATLDVLYPLTPLPSEIPETNEGSIVALFTYGETSFLLTGDLPSEEEFLPEVPKTTVLKAAHHGSRYSTSDRFLDLVQPRDVIISVGKNSYGHPSSEVMERLMRHHAQVFRTDIVGDIVYSCSQETHRCDKE